MGVSGQPTAAPLCILSPHITSVPTLSPFPGAAGPAQPGRALSQASGPSLPGLSCPRPCSRCPLRARRAVSRSLPLAQPWLPGSVLPSLAQAFPGAEGLSRALRWGRCSRWHRLGPARAAPAQPRRCQHFEMLNQFMTKVREKKERREQGRIFSQKNYC